MNLGGVSWMGALGSTKPEKPPKKRVSPYVAKSSDCCGFVIMGCDGEFITQIHRRDPVTRRIGDLFWGTPPDLTHLIYWEVNEAHRDHPHVQHSTQNTPLHKTVSTFVHVSLTMFDSSPEQLKNLTLFAASFRQYFISCPNIRTKG